MKREVARKILRGSVHVVGRELHVRVRGEQPPAWTHNIAGGGGVVEIMIEDCANPGAGKHADVDVVVFLFDYMAPGGQTAKIIRFPVEEVSGRIWDISLCLSLTPAQA